MTAIFTAVIQNLSF